MMNKMILACAGLAVCGATQAQVERGPIVEMGEKLRPITATEVIGLTPEGLPILGKTVDMAAFYAARDAGNSSRAVGFAYDAMGVAPDSDGDGFPEPICGGPCEAGDPLVGGSARYTAAGITQRTFDDFSIDASFGGGNYDGGFTGFRRDGDCATLTSENLDILVQLFDTADTSGTGFDDGTGIITPYDPASFTGGVILGFGDVAATSPQWGFLGFDDLIAAGLVIPMPSTDNDGDPSTVEGGIEISMLSVAEDNDGDGVVETIAPSSAVFGTLGGTDANDTTTGCRTGVSVGATGVTAIGLWAEGQNFCGDPLVNVPWSEGATDPDVDFDYDPLVDAGTFGASPTGCPDELTWANIILADGDVAVLPNPCGDQNGAGGNEPGDFTAWVANFNTNSDGNGDGILDADVNRNGSNEPGDFTAWVAAFNAGLTDDGGTGSCLP